MTKNCSRQTSSGLGRVITARSLLSADGIYHIISRVVFNFINFPPLGIVLVGIPNLRRHLTPKNEEYEQIASRVAGRIYDLPEFSLDDARLMFEAVMPARDVDQMELLFQAVLRRGAG